MSIENQILEKRQNSISSEGRICMYRKLFIPHQMMKGSMKIEEICIIPYKSMKNVQIHEERTENMQCNE